MSHYATGSHLTKMKATQTWKGDGKRELLCLWGGWGRGRGNLSTECKTIDTMNLQKVLWGVGRDRKANAIDLHSSPVQSLFIGFLKLNAEVPPVLKSRAFSEQACECDIQTKATRQKKNLKRQKRHRSNLKIKLPQAAIRTARAGSRCHPSPFVTIDTFQRKTIKQSSLAL